MRREPMLSSESNLKETGFPYRAVVFDWAWTLVDLDTEDDRRPLERVFEFLSERGVGLPNFETFLSRSREVFAGMIENSRRSHREALFEHVINYLLLTFNIHLAGKSTVRELLEQYYDEVYAVRKVFDDVGPTLAALRRAGFPLGIISNTTNPGFMKERECARLGLDSYFQFAIYSSEVPYRKPHRLIFDLATSILKLPAAEILYVGDNLQVDVGGAKAAGMATAWVNRGREPGLPDIVPDHELERLTDLLDLTAREISAKSPAGRR
jgi:HAD superfamily hydrolase (TIGR01549 family)